MKYEHEHKIKSNVQNVIFHQKRSFVFSLQILTKQTNKQLNNQSIIKTINRQYEQRNKTPLIKICTVFHYNF